MASVVCSYFRRGYCKYKDRCRNLHISETCKYNDCANNSCQYRHPLPCRYFALYGVCRFGLNCSYQHDTSLMEQIMSINKNMEKFAEKLVAMEKAIKHLKIGDHTTQHVDPVLSFSSENTSGVGKIAI